MSDDTISRLQQENQQLRYAIEELSILNEIATAINSTKNVNQIIDLIVQKCVKLLKVEQAAVMLLDESNEEKSFNTMIRRADQTSPVMPYRLDTQLTGWMLKHQKALIVNDFPNNNQFQSVTDELVSIQTLLSVPLFTKGRMIGLLTVFNKRSQQGFTHEEQRLLSIIATQSAQVIENARLYEAEQNLFQINSEMQMAHDIQINLLPKEMPHFAGYDIAGISIPAKVVGGDCFDFIPISEHKLAICLGDVSGKGLPAAMLMANLQATIRGQTLVNSLPGSCLGNSNKLLYESTDRQKFATLIYGILDIRNNQFCYANAGHNRPFLVRENQKPVTLETAGIVLSFIKDYTYHEEEVNFNPNDVLFIYSDGITEAMDNKSEEFGEERLASLLEIHKDKSAKELIDTIVEEVKKFSGERLQMDDKTLVVIKRKKTNKI